MLGKLYAFFPTQKKKLVENNLKRVTKEDPSKAQVREAFASYASYYVDAAKLPHISPERIVDGFTITGWEHAEEALAKNNGVIFGLPHMGSWEWAGAWVRLTSGTQITVAIEAIEPPELLDFMVSHRKKLGINAVPVGKDAGKNIMKALRDNHVVCLLSDRYIEGAGTEIEFFGEKTILPIGAATLSIRTKAPLLPACVYLKDKVRHTLICPPIDTTRKGRFREDVARVTIDLTKSLEELIKDAPEQWHLMSPNWPSDRELIKK